MESIEAEKVSGVKKLTVLLHAGFFLVGIITVLLGQILPILSVRLSLNDRQAGYLFVAQFAGSLLGTFSYNRIIKKIGYLKLLSVSFCLTAFGCAGLNFVSRLETPAAIFVYGVGIGLAIPTVNLFIVKLNERKSSSALNIINFFWGAGAILCKPLVDSTVSPGNISTLCFLLAGLFLLTGALFAFSNSPPNLYKDRNSGDTVSAPIWRTATARLIAIFGFVHIGIESSVGGWITTYQSRLAAPLTNVRLSAAFVFFLLLVIGRAVAPLFFRFFGEEVILTGSLIIMTAGAVLILGATGSAHLIAAAAILGFGSSTVFPTNTARFTKTFGADSIHNAAPLFICGSLGGAFTTWLIGFTSTAFGSLQTGFVIILISCILLIVLQIVLAAIKLK